MPDSKAVFESLEKCCIAFIMEYVFLSSEKVSMSWKAFCCNNTSLISLATCSVTCCLSGRASEPTSCTISKSFSSSCNIAIISPTTLFQSGATFFANHGSNVLRYNEYEVSQFIEGKCLLCANFASKAQKTFVTLNVLCVTGSEKSPPGGETAPMTETEPSFFVPSGITRPD